MRFIELGGVLSIAQQFDAIQCWDLIFHCNSLAYWRSVFVLTTVLHAVLVLGDVLNFREDPLGVELAEIGEMLGRDFYALWASELAAAAASDGGGARGAPGCPYVGPLMEPWVGVSLVLIWLPFTGFSRLSK